MNHDANNETAFKEMKDRLMADQYTKIKKIHLL
jgi:hypothetical protein